jgi:hemolysin III
MPESRPQTLAEEIANSLTHGVGLVAAVAAFPALLVAASQRGDRLHVVGACVFGATLVLCYLASTLYHAVPASRAKRVKRALQVVDHAAIFLFIAGTYTPFALGPLRGAVGWTLLVSVWLIALGGVVLKLVVGCGHARLSNALYLGLGWLALLAARPLVASIGAAGFAWLAAGGLAYTAGVAVYVRDCRWRYGHALWHLFVAAGSACHFFAVLRHAWPV